jgi:NitT/TauT family transport system substrate-binding protein
LPIFYCEPLRSLLVGSACANGCYRRVAVIRKNVGHRPNLPLSRPSRQPKQAVVRVDIDLPLGISFAKLGYRNSVNIAMTMGIALSRRGLIGVLSAAAAGTLAWPLAAPGQDKLETASVRLVLDPSTCLAPEYVAEALLRDEGFTTIEYVEVATDADDQASIAEGKADFAVDFALKYVTAIDAGLPITVLGGLHIGCFELFVHESIRNIHDLRGRRIGGEAIGGSSAQQFLVSLGAAIGFDAVRDVHWVTEGTPSPLELFVKGELDAFLAHPPEVQQLRARRVGHVLVSSTNDRPWSQYYCCAIGANNDFIRKHPVATKGLSRNKRAIWRVGVR